MGDVFSLVYSSAATSPFDEDELTDLLRSSRAANETRGITGMLLYRDGRFIQVLEGDESRVRDLAATIGRDPRHAHMRVLLTEHNEQRQFSDWTMGYEPIEIAREPLPPGFRSTFDDLEDGDDLATVVRAVRELGVWFRIRSGRRRR